MGTKQGVILISQIGLVIINLIIIVFGIVALGIGIWAASTDRGYLSISGDEDKNYDSVAVLLAIVGCFILIVGVIGFVGVICGKRMIGRIMLIVYAVIVAIIIIMVLSGAIAGYAQRDDLKDTFRSDARKTLDETPTRHDYLRAWNDAQRDVHCCGVDSFHDWLNITWYDNNTTGAIPLSCCAKVGGCSGDFITEGEATVSVWNKGCVDEIVDKVSDQIGTVAGISITIGIIMMVAVTMACILGLCNKKDSYEVV